MTRLVFAAAVATTALLLPPPGAAAPKPKLYPRSKPVSEMTLVERAAWQRKALSHYRLIVSNYLTWKHSAERRLTLLETRCKALGVRAPYNVCWYGQASRWTSRELSETLKAIQRFGWRPEHMDGWICIHQGEGAWNADTGNGFHGGLQMTYGWMGLVENAATMTPLAQMQAAETGYRMSGYSHSWLAGQWPNTYPPCVAHF